MLQSLSIENFALIKKLQLFFGKGFNVLTGETGAGKSIIIDALNMVLGERADADLIANGQEQALVEAVFEVAPEHRVFKILNEQGIPSESQIIFSRVLLRSGGSQARINSRAVPQSFLKQISRLLVDIHGQHEHQSLLNPQLHLRILDRFGDSDHRGLVVQVREALKNRSALMQQIQNLQKSQESRQKDIEFYQFQLQQFETLNIKPDEDIQLQQYLEQAKNHEKILTEIRRLKMIRPPLIQNIQETHSTLKALGALLPELQSWEQTWHDQQIQIEDFFEQVNKTSQQWSYDPARVEAEGERLQEIRELARKHLKKSLQSESSIVPELLQKQADLGEALKKLLNQDDDILTLQNQLKALDEEVSKKVFELSMKRHALAQKLKKSATQQLQQLNMPHGQFDIPILQKLSATGLSVGGKSYEVFDDGIDATEFLISANPGEPLKPLSKIASGGEISRVMLALKSILGESDNIETMVFDEIDTGIGGETAIAVASALKNLSATKQILCVTHLAQIAAVAQNHLNVEKNTDGQSTAVTVKLLKDAMEIKKEISRLLSGTQTPKTLEHAEELLSGFN